VAGVNWTYAMVVGEMPGSYVAVAMGQCALEVWMGDVDGR